MCVGGGGGGGACVHACVCVDEGWGYVAGGGGGYVGKTNGTMCQENP